jgi:hypothetical protein
VLPELMQTGPKKKKKKKKMMTYNIVVCCYGKMLVNVAAYVIPG